MNDFNKAAHNKTFNAFVMLQDWKLNFKRITDGFTSEDVGTHRIKLLGNTTVMLGEKPLRLPSTRF